MKIPIIYNLRSLRQRPVSTLTTALGMALVVAVFVSMNALANGFRAALVGTGSPENVILLRKGANQRDEQRHRPAGGQRRRRLPVRGHATPTTSR